MAEKLPDEALYQATSVGHDEEHLHNTKSSAADIRDMARMGKPQEMKVLLTTIKLHHSLEINKHARSATSAPSQCLASA
jgi:pyruvate/oxaloacetate carboxyltransferase